MADGTEQSALKRHGIQAAVAAVMAALVYGLGIVIDATLIEYVQRILLIVGIYIILAVGLNLINGTTGQFSIGHAGFMAVGAYACAYAGVHIAPLFGETAVGQALTFNVALVIGAGAAGAAGVLVGVPSLRLKGDYLAIVTLGFAEIIRVLVTNARFLGAATGYSGDSPAGLPIYTTFFWVFAWVLVVVVAIRNVTFSQWGRSLGAIREDEVAAVAMATPTTRLKVMAFTLSAASAGIAGGLFAHMQGGIRPDDFKLDKSIDMIVMIILGGLGSITGAIVGAVFLAVSLELMRDLQEYRMVIYALLLVIIMIVRPQGLFGTRELSLGLLLRKKRATEPSS